MRTRPSAASQEPLHILAIPKWWPNAQDPQLGDFIRKQMQAVALSARVSVLHIEANTAPSTQEVQRTDGLCLVRSTYRASRSRVGAWRKAVNLLRYGAAAARGWARVVSEQGSPALVHVHILVRPALAAWWIKRKYRIPYVLSEQSSEYLDGTYVSKGVLFHLLNRRLFAGAAAITAVSAWLGDGLKRLGLTDRYEVVPNVIPGLDRPLPDRGPADRFLVVADLVDRTKNVSGVIRALAKASIINRPLYLTIIGDGPDRRMLEELVIQHGLSTQVTFLGRLPNSGVLDHMAHAGAVIINSHVETFSVVTGEALAQGKPVIATRCGGPEAFISRNNGILIGVGDTDALALAMHQMSAEHARYDPALIRSELSTRFSPTAVGAAFVDLYRRSLNQA